MTDPTHEASAAKWAEKHTDIQLQALLNQEDDPRTLITIELPPSLKRYISEALKPLIDRIELLESITDQSCGCNGIDHEIKG